MIHDDEHEQRWSSWPGLLPLAFALGGGVHLGLLLAHWVRS